MPTASEALSNPFYHRGPISNSAHFFGRAKELRQLCGLIQNGQSISLIGPRRIGKSSLLTQLRLPQLQERYGLTANTHTIIYLSGDAWHDRSSNAIYAAIWSAVCDAEEESRATDFAARLLPDPMVRELDFTYFQYALSHRQGRARWLVLLLDEFDAFSRNRYLDESFFSSLRSLVATQRIVFVTASTASLLDLAYAQQSALSSPFFNIFLPQRLGLLSTEEGMALLVGTAAIGGVTLEMATCKHLLNRAGLHPLLLQIAGYHWWEAEQSYAANHNDTLDEAIATEAYPYWLYQWQYLTIAQQRALALLATPEPQPAALLQTLQHACLIHLVMKQATYLSPLFHDFVRQQTVHQIIQVGQLLIDQTMRRAWLMREPLVLSPQDYRLLETLARHAGRRLTQAELADYLWADEQGAINHQTRLKAAINSLRRKLGQQDGLIVTDAGGGYRLVQSDAESMAM